MKYSQLVLITVPLILSGCNAETTRQKTSHATTNSRESLKATTPNNVKTQGIWIDVREADEYAQGHLKEALNITGRDLPSRIISIAPNKDTLINLYCRSGNRSEKARQILLNMGYTNVINQGGYQGLYNKGYR